MLDWYIEATEIITATEANSYSSLVKNLQSDIDDSKKAL